MVIVNSGVVSHSMQANVLELMKGLERRSFLKLGQRNSQLWWDLSLRPRVPGEHMCNSTQHVLCRAELPPLTYDTQTNKRERHFHGQSCSVVDRATFFFFLQSERERARVSFQLWEAHSGFNPEQKIALLLHVCRPGEAQFFQSFHQSN